MYETKFPGTDLQGFVFTHDEGLPSLHMHSPELFPPTVTHQGSLMCCLYGICLWIALDPHTSSVGMNVGSSNPLFPISYQCVQQGPKYMTLIIAFIQLLVIGNIIQKARQIPIWQQYIPALCLWTIERIGYRILHALSSSPGEPPRFYL